MLLLEQLKQIPDHRGLQGKKYPLWVLMSLVVVGTFCGYLGYRPLANFCRQHREKLWRLLEIDESIECPSYSTFRRTLLEVPSQHWETMFNVWALATVPQKLNRCASIDGKSIR